MNNKTTYTIVAIATLAALLVTTTAASNAYAGGHHHHHGYAKQSQSLAQANACGNGPLPIHIDCQNAGSQIQGKRNAASVAASQ
ncbi:MAG TPA: hypothetical protein VH796_06710 [Nitrososphaeraceae archaeon]|jgi:hypothetical protein